jgi:hypothetical protein
MNEVMAAAVRALGRGLDSQDSAVRVQAGAAVLRAIEGRTNDDLLEWPALMALKRKIKKLGRDDPDFMRRVKNEMSNPTDEDET